MVLLVCTLRALALVIQKILNFEGMDLGGGSGPLGSIFIF